MSDRRIAEPTLERMFAERAGRLTQPRAGFEELLATAAATPQQRHRWLPAGLSRPQASVVGAALAAVAVAVVAIGSLTLVLPATPDAVTPDPPAAEIDLPVAEVPEGAPALTEALHQFLSINTASIQTEAISAGIEQVVGDGTAHDLEGTTAFAVGPDGRVWVARGNRVFQLGVPGVYTRGDGVRQRVFRLWTGADGRPMIRGNQGYSILTGDRFELIEAEGDLEGPVTTAVDGSIWGLVHGGLERVAESGHTSVTLASMGLDWPDDVDLDESRFRTLAAASDGALWGAVALSRPDRPAAGPQEANTAAALVRWDGERWERMTPPRWTASDIPAPDSVQISGLFAGPEGSMLVPFLAVDGWARDDNLAYWDGEAWHLAVAPANAAAAAVDAREHAWYLVPGAIGTAALYRYDGETWVRRDLDLGRRQQGDWTLAAAPDGTLWLHDSAGDSARLLILDPHELGFDQGV